MARQMVGQRKGAPAVAIHIQSGNPKDPADSQAGDVADDAKGDDGISDSAPDVVTCPECGCQFDPNAPAEDYADKGDGSGDGSNPSDASGGGDVAALVASKLNQGAQS